MDDTPSVKYNAPPYVDGEIEVFDQFLAFIYSEIRDYRENGDPVVLYNIFKQCHDNRVYPPVEIMDWLANAVLQDDPNKIPVRLGLKPQAPGHKNPVDVSRRRWMNDYYATLIWTLCHFAGISISAAAEGIYLREFNAGCEVPAASWMEDQYRRRWKKHYTADPLLGLYENHPDLLQAFISSFPRDWQERYVLKS